MKSKRKVLLVGPMPPPSGGVSIHLSRLLQKSVEYHDIDLAVFDLRKRKLFSGNGKRKGFINAILFFLNAGIIHIHLSHPVKVSIARIGKFLGKKIIYTQHNVREIDSPSTKKIIKLAHRVIYVFGNENDAQVIPAYIPSQDKRPLPKELDDTFNKYDKILVSLCTSALDAKNEEDIYGFDIILDAIELLPSRKGMAVIFVDANNTYREKYADRIKSIEKNKEIAIHYINMDLNFTSLITHASIYIRAARNDGDSISVREALQNSTPVLASNCISRPNGCILFQSGDGRDLADQITAVLGNNERKRHDQEDFSKRIFSIYLD